MKFRDLSSGRTLILLPVNGLVNRLRAIASSYIWAQENDYKLQVIWNTSEAMNCEAKLLFGEKTLSKYFIETRNSDILKFGFETYPTYRYEKEKSILYLAGGREGEQKLFDLMHKEKDLENSGPQRLFVRSGGLFHRCFIKSCKDCETFKIGRAHV